MQKQAIIFFSRSVSTEAVCKPMSRRETLSRKIIGEMTSRIGRNLRKVETDKYWFSDVPIDQSRLRQFRFKENFVQTGDSLRERIENAFHTLFGLGYEEVAIVGNDTCLSTTEINNALARRKDVVGRSIDGGFYLLKISRSSSGRFVLRDKYWNEGCLNVEEFDFEFLDAKYDIDSFIDFTKRCPWLAFVKMILNEIFYRPPSSVEGYMASVFRKTGSHTNRPPPVQIAA